MLPEKFPAPEDLDCVGKALTEFSACNEDEVKQVGAKKTRKF